MFYRTSVVEYLLGEQKPLLSLGDQTQRLECVTWLRNN